MNQMTPTDFHDRLEAAMPDDSADRPLHEAVEADVLSGRRLLRRRRGVTVLGAAAAVAVVATGIGLGSGLGDGSAYEPSVATPPSGEAAELESCRTGEISHRAREAMFGNGAPTVKASARTGQRIVLVVESADGSHWGECSINLAADAEFPSYMTAYDARGRTTSSSYSTGWDCEREDVCRGFSVWMTDRRPDAVAAVEFVTADGETSTVESVDGYVAFAYAGELSEPISERRMTSRFSALARITFLDASGTPIAAEARDGSGLGPDHERVPGLPPLTEFPSLRSDEGF